MLSDMISVLIPNAMKVTGTKLATIGISGPLPGKDYAVDLDIKVT